MILGFCHTPSPSVPQLTGQPLLDMKIVLPLGCNNFQMPVLSDAVLSRFSSMGIGKNSILWHVSMLLLENMHSLVSFKHCSNSEASEASGAAIGI